MLPPFHSEVVTRKAIHLLSILMSSDPNPIPGSSLGPETAKKRRKIRKGTTSCWECKRRKVRCSLVDDPEAACVSCRRRGTTCVTQDHPNEVDETTQLAGGRMRRVEALIDRLVGASAQEPNTPSETRGTTGSPCSIPPGELGSVYASHSAGRQGGTQPLHQNPYAEISRELHASLPSREDVAILWKMGSHISISFHGVMMIPYPDLERDGLNNFRTLLDMPGPESHPVHLARYMFLVATVLQYLDLEKSRQQINAMTEPPRVIMKRLAETAIRLVTTRNELLGTVEGLECIMMEGMYQANCGNVRTAWMAFRRAMALAQLMRIPRPGHSPLPLLDPRHKYNSSFLWYRIVYTDRLLCLLMGLPQGSLDRSMAADDALSSDTPLGRLERVHCAIASRILECNEADPGSFTIDTIREVDRELQRAAEMMPSGWWMVPNLEKASAYIDKSDGNCKLPANCWEMLRLVTQIYHYNMLNQLHLPFMLRFTSAERIHDYSKTACVHASREILTRSIVFRSFNRVAYCCRVLDFFTLIAALLLLIAHLRQHARAPDELNFMVHQRQSDRAMVEQVVTDMREIGRVGEDPVTSQSADLLSQLLDVEAEAAKGRAYSTQNLSPAEAAQGTESCSSSTANVLYFSIPYFGMIRIAPEGDISKESPPQGEMDIQGYPPPDVNLHRVHTTQPGTTLANGVSSELVATTAQHQYGFEAVREDPISGTQSGLGPLMPPPPQSWFEYPGLTAGVEDWALQGVDMAFFDNLMRAP
ncbi:hypothetical protein BDW59DRAFT_34788 [Aspergillus cavernicola]|uniref:Zn(2)-C6 fungal-type domain-containing protein n=1 Tax=Aspergillus cavernicola TaxID=176166 RepID=A0ABR4HCJ9_9EURO